MTLMNNSQNAKNKLQHEILDWIPWKPATFSNQNDETICQSIDIFK